MAISEKKYRSLFKALSWRATATCATLIISFLITGSFAIAFKIGAAEILIKIALYYFHERAWLFFDLGAKKRQ
jgi:uncharacterized membrane protein